MLGKLIVWGETREEALARSRRARSEYKVEGMPTVIPFHQAITADPAFIGDGESFDIYTKWIEEEWKNEVPAYVDPAEAAEESDELPAQKYVVEVDGRRVEVALPGNLVVGGGAAPRKKSKKRRGAGAKADVSGDTVVAPMQGTVIKVNVENGQEVEEGEVIVVLEAMKMENPVKAHKSGIISDLAVETGSQINKGNPILEIK